MGVKDDSLRLEPCELFFTGLVRSLVLQHGQFLPSHRIKTLQ
jgi:hypothetical protein